MKFSQVIGHEEQKSLLRYSVDNDQLPHALLISGPSGIGKMTLARALAQYIHCTNRVNGDSCGKCPSCRQHQSLNNPDMHYVYPIVKKSSPKLTVSEDYLSEWIEFVEEDPMSPYERWLELMDAGNSQPMIYVDESAEILRKMHHSSFAAKHKIMLMWLPEKMNEEAANKLLKIIEEPFEDTKFIFVSNEPQAILPTIFSRTQRVNLKKLSPSEIALYLCSTYGIDENSALEIASISDGNVNVAVGNVSLSGETAEFRKIFQEMMRKAYMRDIRSLKDIADKIASMGREKNRRFLAYCASMVRENFIYNLQTPSLNCLNAEDRQFSSRFSPFINEHNVEGMMTEINLAENDIARNANAKIVMFDFCIKLIILIKT